MTFNTNAAVVLILALTNLNNTLAKGGRKNKVMNYPIFSRREDKNIDDFINDLKKVFIVNRIADGRKYVVAVSYLKETVISYYDRFIRITNWNDRT